MTYPWKTFTRPLIVGDEGARAIMRDAEAQRRRDIANLGDILAELEATMKKSKPKGGKKKGGGY